MNAQQTVHVVKEGEWLWKIAREYKVDPQAIIAANKLANPDAIKPGQQLIIPGGAPVVPQVTHVVQEGEWVWKIARQYGVDPQAIITANKLPAPHDVKPGQRLIIPGAAPVISQVVHMVASGDTLDAIARRYGITVEKIAEINNIAVTSPIKVGQKLTIPA